MLMPVCECSSKRMCVSSVAMSFRKLSEQRKLILYTLKIIIKVMIESRAIRECAFLCTNTNEGQKN